MTVAAEAVAPASTPSYEAPPASPSYETEQVREFRPRETAMRETAPAPSGPGYAPAVPIKMEWSSDLQQVESNPEKVRAAEERVVEEETAPRPKRVRQPLPPVDDVPLVQVETSELEAAAAGGQKEKETALPG